MEKQILTLLGVILGGLITYGTAYSIETKKIKKENEQKKFETKMKMFQTLEFLEKKCEYYIMDYQGMGDYLELKKFPTFHLIRIDKLSYVKFLIKHDYKNEYTKFIEIEEKLKKRREEIKSKLFDIKHGFILDWQDVYLNLSEEIYKELKIIIKEIKDIKEKI